MATTHKHKLRMARGMRDHRKKYNSVFDTDAWSVRRAGIAGRVKRQVVAAQKRHKQEQRATRAKKEGILQIFK